MDNENTKVHIWELPEKVSDIDKSNDYTIIHDGIATKKIKVEKLYDYFNQDYKIDNVVLFFETLLEKENARYEELYETLEISLNEYDEIITEFVNKFTANRDKIRELETSTNQMSFDIEDITKSFESIGDKNSKLSETIKEYSDSVSEKEVRNEILSENISETNNTVSSIYSDKDDIEGNIEYTTKSIERISESVDTQVEEKGESLTKNINDAYDRIVSIIDYYHHIHDQEII